MKRILGPMTIRILAFGGLFAGVFLATPSVAADYAQPEALCYDCIRDAIYADVSRIDYLEAEPDYDEGVKGPMILAARADIHRLRALLGPVPRQDYNPCCYSRKRLYLR